VSRAVSPLQLAQNELARLETAKTALLHKWTEDHPDVLKIEREIAKAEETVNLLKAAPPRPEKDEGNSTKAVARTAPADEAADDPTITQLKSQLEVNRMEIQNLSKDEKQLKGMIEQYEIRLNQMPVREQQQAAILRDTGALRLEYADLLKKEQESQLATSLETQQAGQQFRLVDAASLPQVPSSPNRLKMSLAGIAGGLFVGVALAFFFDKRDTSFHSEKDATKHLGGTFVFGVPLLPTRAERRRRKWRIAFEWLAGSTLVLVVLVAEFFVYITAVGGAR
jgi:hypothetical protein